MSMQVSTSALGGGHSSRPSLSGTPISVLAAACSKIQNNQFPAHLTRRELVSIEIPIKCELSFGGNVNASA
jgi:hypothetical protein